MITRMEKSADNVFCLELSRTACYTFSSEAIETIWGSLACHFSAFIFSFSFFVAKRSGLLSFFHTLALSISIGWSAFYFGYSINMRISVVYIGMEGHMIIP